MAAFMERAAVERAARVLRSRGRDDSSAETVGAGAVGAADAGAGAGAAEDVTEAPAAGDVAGTTDSSKGSPDTGVEDVAVVAGLAIVAAGAVLVSKKRK